MKIRPVGAELFLADGQTDTMKLIVRNFVNAPKSPSVVESRCNLNPKVIGGLRTCLKLVSDPWRARLYIPSTRRHSVTIERVLWICLFETWRFISVFGEASSWTLRWAIQNPIPVFHRHLRVHYCPSICGQFIFRGFPIRTVYEFIISYLGACN